MKYGDEELTGKELGTIRFSFNNEKARDYVGIARRYLGDMKQHMQLADITQLYDEKTMRDGTVIKMWSNKNGAADIDMVDINTPNIKSKLKRGEKLCLGYIVQVFTTQGTKPVELYYDFKITTPTGKTIGFDQDSGEVQSWGDLQGLPIALNDAWPDNGALYWPRHKYNPGTGTWSDTAYQEVITKLYEYGIKNTGLGPISLNILGPGTIADETLYPHSLYFETGEGPFSYSYVKDTPFGTFTSGSVGSAPTDMENVNTIANWYNEINIAGYAYDMENTYFDEVTLFYDLMLQYPSTYEVHIYRREDGHGFIAHAGLSSDGNGYILHNRCDNIAQNRYGDGFAFMMPTKEKKIFRWADDINSDNEGDSLFTSQYEQVGLYMWDTFPHDTVPNYAVPNIWYPNELYENPYILCEDNYFDPNVISDQGQFNEVADSFGIPCNVENGEHKINIKRNVIDAGVITVKFWLLVYSNVDKLENGIKQVGNEMKYEYVTYSDIDFVDTKELNKEFTVKVGLMHENMQTNELISISDYTPIE